MSIFDDHTISKLPPAVQARVYLVQSIEETFASGKLKRDLDKLKNTYYFADLDCIGVIEKYLNETLKKQSDRHLRELGMIAWNAHVYSSKTEKDVFDVVIWYWMGTDNPTEKVKIEGLKL